MKDLISCFNACNISIKDDSDVSDDKKPKASSIDDDRKRRREKKQVGLGTTVEKGGGGGEESPASCQSCESEEDEYIVFYFKDHNAGEDVIEERGPESSLRRKQRAASANHRKKRETGKIQADAKLNIPLETEEPNDPKEHNNTLSESSDSSTRSFAFPTIQREWTGSPALMPRPEGHNKSRNVCIQCCKF